MIKQKTNQKNRQRRHTRVRGRVAGTESRPRVAVFRSLRFISVQAIDDKAGKTLAQASSGEVKQAKNNLAGARAVGKLLGERMMKLGKKQAVFDRAGYKYHGRVKELADGVRESGVVM